MALVENYKQGIQRCNTNEEFWSFLKVNFDRISIEGAFALMKEIHPDVRITADLMDATIVKTLRIILNECEMYGNSMQIKGRILSYIDMFINSESKLKASLLDTVIEICVEKKERGEGEKGFFLEMIKKNLITPGNTTGCIQKCRDRELIDLIPILILNERGYYMGGKEKND